MRQCFGRGALRRGRGDRPSAVIARGRGRMSYAEWGKSVLLRLLPSPSPSSSSSSLSERMRQRFVPGHFFRFADNKPSRFASSLPSFPPSLFPLLSMERRSPPPPTPRCEWRYGNTGDVKIGPLFIASSLLINCIVSGNIFNRHDVDRWKPTSCSAKREAICMKNQRISPLPFPPECV